MLSPLFFLLFGLFGGLIFLGFSFFLNPGTGSYYGAPTMTREKFFEDFLNHIEYLAAKGCEENHLNVGDMYFVELEHKLNDIKLVASENVYIAAKKLFNYTLTHFRDQSELKLYGYSVLRKQYIEATKKEI
jgi:hypothetical protein